MFGLLSRGVSAFMASVSGTQKDESGLEGSSNDDSRSVKSTNSSIRRTSDSPKSMTATRQQFNVEPVKGNDLEEIVQFLLDNFAQTEAILASLKIEDPLCISELTTMLRDLVLDSLSCPSSCLVRDVITKKIDGIALTSRHSIFEKQLDRLYNYRFDSQKVRDAQEFLKYVFNKLDVTYYLGEHRVYKPVFAAVVCVRKEVWNQGIGTALMNHVQKTARTDNADGLISLCSNHRGHNLMTKYLNLDFASVRYDAFKGEHLKPPIVMGPPEKFHTIHELFRHFLLTLTKSCKTCRMDEVDTHGGKYEAGDGDFLTDEHKMSTGSNGSKMEELKFGEQLQDDLINSFCDKLQAVCPTRIEALLAIQFLIISAPEDIKKHVSGERDALQVLFDRVRAHYLLVHYNPREQCVYVYDSLQMWDRQTQGPLLSAEIADMIRHLFGHLFGDLIDIKFDQEYEIQRDNFSCGYRVIGAIVDLARGGNPAEMNYNRTSLLNFMQTILDEPKPVWSNFADAQIGSEKRYSGEYIRHVKLRNNWLDLKYHVNNVEDSSTESESWHSFRQAKNAKLNGSRLSLCSVKSFESMDEADEAEPEVGDSKVQRAQPTLDDPEPSRMDSSVFNAFRRMLMGLKM
ncbi:unnamed protein product [Caenorhabditis sp. 36 PRJEB53466]|nr:unnamed protein product [Caenorhabditis sp. 36 PRJEB53466]